jgi:hypothetical protein
MQGIGQPGFARFAHRWEREFWGSRAFDVECIDRPGIQNLNSEIMPENGSVYLEGKLAYVVFHLSLGINVLIHGASRIFGPGAEAFASKAVSQFAGTPLPSGLRSHLWNGTSG